MSATRLICLLIAALTLGSERPLVGQSCDCATLFAMFNFQLDTYDNPWYWGPTWRGPYTLPQDPPPPPGYIRGWNVHEDFLPGMRGYSGDGYSLNVGFGITRAQALALMSQAPPCYVKVHMTAYDLSTNEVVKKTESGYLGDTFGGGWWAFAVRGGSVTNRGPGNPGWPNGVEIQAKISIKTASGVIDCPQAAHTFVQAK